MVKLKSPLLITMLTATSALHAEPTTQVDIYEFNEVCSAAEYPDETAQKLSQSKGHPLALSVYPNRDIGDRPHAITNSLRDQGIKAECIIGRVSSSSGRTEYGFYAAGTAIRGSDGKTYHSFDEIMGNKEFRDLIKGRAIVAQSGK